MPKVIATIHTSMHEELPKGKKVRGKLTERYEFAKGLYWMEVRLQEGVKRDIIVKNPRRK